MIPAILADEARAELRAAAAYYEDKREGLGEEFVDEFLRAVRRIQDVPKGWAKVSEKSRRCQLDRFPYGVIYQVTEEEIVLLAIMHMSRKPGYWTRRER